MERIEFSKEAAPLRAAVILKGSRVVAILRTLERGRSLTVEVEQSDKARERSEMAMRKARCVPNVTGSQLYQSRTVSGWGFDKVTTALAGTFIDGHRMAPHAPGRPGGLESLTARGYRVVSAL